MEQVKVGGETSAYCTSCRAMRHHVVVAMTGAVPAKVECLSCHKQHRYKAAPPGTKTPRVAGADKKPAGTRTVARVKSTAIEPVVDAVNPLDALLATRSMAGARGYSPVERYAVGELVSHPSFGIGAVTGVPSPGKIAVLFRDTTRLLMHERPPAGAAAPPKLLRPPARREDAGVPGPSDAPPKIKTVV